MTQVELTAACAALLADCALPRVANPAAAALAALRRGADNAAGRHLVLSVEAAAAALAAAAFAAEAALDRLVDAS